MRRMLGVLRRVREVVAVVVSFSMVSFFPVLVVLFFSALFVGSAVVSFRWFRDHSLSSGQVFWLVFALACVSMAGLHGPLRSGPDRDSLYFRFRNALDDYQFKRRLRADDRETDRKVARVKRARRRVLDALRADGPATAAALTRRLGMSAADLDSYLDHALWRGWISESVGTSGPVFGLTARGARELEAPGSTDDEPLEHL